MESLKPQVMGILNVTPDSFYDGGQHYRLEDAVQQALRLVDEGADILDLGGESSRPPQTYGEQTKELTESEELQRVVPVIVHVAPLIKIPLSIDTRRPAVAAAAINAGASIVNDITGCQCPQMRKLVAETGVSVCVMHMQGTPRTMQQHPSYPMGVVPTIQKWLKQQITELIACGIDQNKIIVDPGIGFGKTVDHNLDILRNLKKFKELGCRVLIGASRKSFIQKILKKPAENILSATIAAHTIALAEQADILRVHDVAAHRDVIDFYSAIY